MQNPYVLLGTAAGADWWQEHCRGLTSGIAVGQGSMEVQGTRPMAEHRAVGIVPEGVAMGVDEVQGSAIRCLVSMCPCVR